MIKEIESASRSGAAVEPKRTREELTFSPHLDVIEKPESLVVLADVPDVEKGKLEVALEEGILTINGEVRQPPEEAMRLLYREYETGDFHRAVEIGEGWDPEKVEAAATDGVLRIVIPKSERLKARRIQIKGE